jgi:hypothetical protein
MIDGKLRVFFFFPWDDIPVLIKQKDHLPLPED